MNLLDEDNRPEILNKEWMAWFVLALFFMIVMITTVYDIQDKTLDNPYPLIAAYITMPFIGGAILIKGSKRKKLKNNIAAFFNRIDIEMEEMPK